MADPNQKYKIIDKLDEGGMAEIYRAEVESIQGFKKQIAIKRVLPHLTENKKFVAMFLDEARVSLHFNHANIVQVFDIGKSDNSYFIVMEFVEGLNLRSLTESLRSQSRPMSIPHTIFIMMEVCKGLGYAHALTDPGTGEPMHIVHRDISPPNILLSKQGEVKLVDFGLAKAASQLERTDPGVVKGKFSYLSPEAADGNEVDLRADIFAAGIIFFELLTGRRLFYGETDLQTVELVRRAKIPPMTALNHEITPELERIVLKALARDPAQRYQQAYELEDALANYLFSRGMKVTNRDIATLVQGCQRERRLTVPPPVKTGNVIDALIQEEVLKFTSLDGLERDEPAGAKPLNPGELGGGAVDGGKGLETVDTRGWVDEFSESDDEVLTFPASGELVVKKVPTVETMLDDLDEEELSGEERVAKPVSRPHRTISRARPRTTATPSRMLPPDESATTVPRDTSSGTHEAPTSDAGKPAGLSGAWRGLIIGLVVLAALSALTVGVLLFLNRS